jgi:hypothetical protein
MQAECVDLQPTAPTCEVLGLDEGR